jgi:hypothetical protein
MSKLEGKTIQDAIDPYVRATCQDLDALEKTLKLALLCTKLNPSQRPSMYDVSQVLLSLLPIKSQAESPTSLKNVPASSKPRRYIDVYNSHKQGEENSHSRDSSGEDLLNQFEEAISRKL